MSNSEYIAFSIETTSIGVILLHISVNVTTSEKSIETLSNICKSLDIIAERVQLLYTVRYGGNRSGYTSISYNRQEVKKLSGKRGKVSDEIFVTEQNICLSRENNDETLGKLPRLFF